MEGVEKIKNKILSDAKKEADKILNEAKKEVAEIEKEKQKQLDIIKKKRETEIKQAVKLYKDKTIAQARLKAKREYLDKREEIIDKYVREVILKIDRKSNDYKNFLKNIIDQNINLLSGEITIYCNKKDIALLKSMNISSSLKESNIEAGIIFEDSTGKRIDETISSRLERRKDKIRRGIIKILGA